PACFEITTENNTDYPDQDIILEQSGVTETFYFEVSGVTEVYTLNMSIRKLANCPESGVTEIEVTSLEFAGEGTGDITGDIILPGEETYSLVASLFDSTTDIETQDCDWNSGTTTCDLVFNPPPPPLPATD
ncbi:hypothetical protein ACFL7M_17995, partial [Thermodesulfobacteriota bacterium]